MGTSGDLYNEFSTVRPVRDSPIDFKARIERECARSESIRRKAGLPNSLHATPIILPIVTILQWLRMIGALI